MIVCNFSIYSSFLDTSVRNTGRITMPEYYDKFVGMLSAVIVGYIFDKDLIIIKMCFGELWGDHGYGYITKEYLEKLGNDLWIVNIHSTSGKSTNWYQRSENKSLKNESIVDEDDNNQRGIMTRSAVI